MERRKTGHTFFTGDLGGFDADESVLELFAQAVLLAQLERNSSCFTGHTFFTGVLGGFNADESVLEHSA